MREKMANKDKIAVLEEPFILREFAAVIEASCLVVSGSTGPMHLAAAMGVKTLSFFPPDEVAAMRAKRWGPLGNISEIIKPAIVNKKPQEAMDTIPTEFITDKIRQLMAR